MVFGQLEEGADGDAVTVGPEAVVVLAVAFLLVVCGIEAAEAVEVGSAGFSQCIGKSETDAEPVAVIGREVNAGCLDTPSDEFDVPVRVSARDGH